MNKEEKKAVEDIKRELSDEDKKEYMSSWFAKDLDIAVNLIEKLQKENEELKETYKSEKKMKNEYVKLYQDLLLKENVIPKQKVKDKIEEYKNMLKTCNKAKDIDRIKAINERILELEELLEGRK